MPHDPVDDLPVDPDVIRRPVQRGHQRRWDIALAIAAGGAIGGSLRYATGQLISSSERGFPWSTFTENVVGCFVLAALMVYMTDVWRPQRYLRPFLGTGVLGGFTTFSTYANETRELLQTGELMIAFLYVAGTVVVGLLATVVGLRGARRVAGVGAVA
ncbi:MAG: fluoride efflux transporter CrcB [Jiangellales bacterium]